MAAGDLRITATAEWLTIEAERTVEAPEGAEPELTERGELKLSRKLRFPAGVDADGVEATLADGVLTVRVPKAGVVEPRRVEVQAA